MGLCFSNAHYGATLAAGATLGTLRRHPIVRIGTEAILLETGFESSKGAHEPGSSGGLCGTLGSGLVTDHAGKVPRLLVALAP